VSIQLTCACGRKLQVRDEFAGQEGKCPACGNTFRIPNPDAAGTAGYTETPAARELPPEPPAEQQPSGPPTEMRNHAGDPLPGGLDFFVPAPEEVGPVMSAHTTLKVGQEPWTAGSRLLLAAGLSLFGLVGGLFITSAASVRSPFWLVAWPGGLMLLILFIVIGVTGFSHTCTYVGRDGVARYTCSGRRDNIETAEVFRFRDANDLRTSQTLRYVNGAYQNTTYSYTWYDITGRTRYVIGGSHSSEANTPPSKDPYHWARAAELAWTWYLLDQSYRQLQLSGSVLFHLPGGRWIRLGERRLAHNLNGTEETWDADDIGLVTIKQGIVSIKRKGAREGWFSSEGVLKFNFDQLGNAQLFFHLLEKVVGVSVGG
jgi:hypothetical protein